MPDELAKAQKRSSKALVLAAIVVLVLIVGTVAWLAVQSSNKKSEYTKHSSISIDGNGGFTKANGVVGGSGTASDPYILANWDVNASAGIGIEIRSTDAHFIVRNCYVHDGYASSGQGDGIYLRNCANGSLENNNCSRDLTGIVLSQSDNNTLIGNTCLRNLDAGIVLGSSSNNTLANNSCNSNRLTGIWLGLSNYNKLINNSCSSNLAGILLYQSGHDYLSDNNCSLNDLGMQIGESSYNRLTSNNCSSNRDDGMWITELSDNNEVSRNLFFSNWGRGVNISSLPAPSSDNRISNNTFIGNNGATNTYNASHAQAYDDGTHNMWNSTDGYGNYWGDWTTPDANHDGIVDQPYTISGSADAKDYYPLTTP